MEHKIILPADPSIYDHPMVKFKFITDDYSLSFVIVGSMSEDKLKEELNDLNKGDLNKIMNIVADYFKENQIGKEEFSEITSVVKIKRLLPS